MISIIIPNYNKENYILQTINSVFKQSYNNWECIIVDDNSTDKSVEIIQLFINNKERFRLILNDVNHGASHCRNIGLNYSIGDYILFLDSDDLLHKDCLNSRINTMLNNQQLNFAVFPIGTFLRKIGDSNYVWNSFRVNHLISFLSHDLPWAICSVIWTRNTLIKLNGFDISFFRLQDVELHSRALLSKNINYQTFGDLYPDCFYRINNDRIDNIIIFLKKDIVAKLFYIENFSSKLKGDKSFLKFLSGTYFECYSPTFHFYNKSKINFNEMSFILDFIKMQNNNYTTNKMNNLILDIYIYIRKNNIYFKGMHYFFKKLFKIFS